MDHGVAFAFATRSCSCITHTFQILCSQLYQLTYLRIATLSCCQSAFLLLRERFEWQVLRVLRDRSFKHSVYENSIFSVVPSISKERWLGRCTCLRKLLLRCWPFKWFPLNQKVFQEFWEELKMSPTVLLLFVSNFRNNSSFISSLNNFLLHWYWVSFLVWALILVASSNLE